jgi:hypothetical protein
MKLGKIWLFNRKNKNANSNGVNFPEIKLEFRMRFFFCKDNFFFICKDKLQTK